MALLLLIIPDALSAQSLSREPVVSFLNETTPARFQQSNNARIVSGVIL
jgi:hypothetical protein